MSKSTSSPVLCMNSSGVFTEYWQLGSGEKIRPGDIVLTGKLKKRAKIIILGPLAMRVRYEATGKLRTISYNTVWGKAE